MGFLFVNKEIFNNNPDDTIACICTALNTRKYLLRVISLKSVISVLFRFMLRHIVLWQIYSVYQKQDRQRREPKPLYTNLNVEHARSLILANPNGVGVRDGWNISLVFGETTIRQSKNMLKRLDMVQQNQMQ